MKTKRDKIKEKIANKHVKRAIRGESWRYMRLSRSSWRKPVGVDNKMRYVFARGTKGGLPHLPGVGNRTDNEIRGMHPSGYIAVTVHSEGELVMLKPKHHAIMIGSSVGRKKRVTLREIILERGFKLLNPGIKAEPIKAESLVAPEDVDATVGKVERPATELSADDLKDVDVDKKEDDKK